MWISVYVHETRVQNTAQWTLLSYLRLDPKRENRLLKSWEVYYWVGIVKISRKVMSQAPIHISIPWVLNHNRNPLHSKLCSHSIGVLDFGVSQILDPSVKLTLIASGFNIWWFHMVESDTWDGEDHTCFHDLSVTTKCNDGRAFTSTIDEPYYITLVLWKGRLVIQSQVGFLTPTEGAIIKSWPQPDMLVVN